MKTTINVGSKTLELANNAFTPILYRQIFKKDFLSLFASMLSRNKEVVAKALKVQALKAELDGEKITKEEYLQKFADVGFDPEDYSIIDEKADLMSELAFVMAKQAEIEEASKLIQLTSLDYYNFLSQFDKNDLRSAAVINELIAFWQGNTVSKVEAKNI